MRIARTLTMLVTVVLLLAPVTGVVGTASAATATQLSISGSPGLGVYRDDIGPNSTPDRVRHRGQLTTGDGVPVVGVTVELERKLVGGEWEALTVDAVTDEEGRYEFLSYIEGNARYKVVYDGDDVHDPAESVVVKLMAMRDFNAVLVERRGVAILKGNVNPGWNNKVVRWQKKTCKRCTWETLERARTGDRGGWRFRGYYPAAGKRWFYRAELDATKRFARSRSGVLVTTSTGRVPAARTLVR